MPQCIRKYFESAHSLPYCRMSRICERVFFLVSMLPNVLKQNKKFEQIYE